MLLSRASVLCEPQTQEDKQAAVSLMQAWGSLESTGALEWNKLPHTDPNKDGTHILPPLTPQDQ